MQRSYKIIIKIELKNMQQLQFLMQYKTHFQIE